jgi:hypothetical protein
MYSASKAGIADTRLAIAQPYALGDGYVCSRFASRPYSVYTATMQARLGVLNPRMSKPRQKDRLPATGTKDLEKTYSSRELKNTNQKA